MKNLGRRSRNAGPNRLSRLLASEFRGDYQAQALLDEFLRHETHNNDFCLKLLAVAKQRSGVPWDVRRLAILMLEHQMLKLPPSDFDHFDLLFTELNLKEAAGPDKPIARKVLKEGYSTTDVRRFVFELRRKLERLNHVHERIRGTRTSENALRDFIELSRRDCQLSLARYVFSPEEVVDEIFRQLHVTDGLKDLDCALVEAEIRYAQDRLPNFEAAILKRLCENSKIYWVSETTRSEIHSLVEYPLTTVVLVIKAPGSDIEFEIKRAGRKGHNSLNVVYARDGYTVPPSHRLDGGSMQWLLRFEANAASKLSLIYRLVHGSEAPMANYMSRSCIYSVPARKTEVQILPYFTEAHWFGDAFPQMRVAMQESVASFIEEGSANLPVIQSDLGLTAQFIGQVSPAQAILSGTSSFRLDKLAAYLSADGTDRYFTEGLRISYSTRDAKRFADQILQETLGSYRPPNVRHRSHKQYLAAAYRVPENRNAADRIYLSIVQQIAKFWGTLLAVRGYSRGESFVARNVGLKSVWIDGEWKVRIIFMDHDALVIPSSDVRNFYARSTVPEMALDERYVWGGRNQAQFAISEVGYLQSIYRVSDDLCMQGEVLARRELKDAYRRTQDAVSTNQRLRRLFSERFVDRLSDWDSFATGYLGLNGDKRAAAAWKKTMERTLAARGYRPEAFETYAETIERNREFLEKYRELFDS